MDSIKAMRLPLFTLFLLQRVNAFLPVFLKPKGQIKAHSDDEAYRPQLAELPGLLLSVQWAVVLGAMDQLPLYKLIGTGRNQVSGESVTLMEDDDIERRELLDDILGLTQSRRRKNLPEGPCHEMTYDDVSEDYLEGRDT